MYLPIGGGVGRQIRRWSFHGRERVHLLTDELNDSCLQPGLLTALLSK